MDHHEFGNYSPALISIFNVLGSHYVDLFFNSTYASALDRVRNSERSSVTDTYTGLVRAYIRGVKRNADIFQKSSQSLFEYVRRNTSLPLLSYADFEEKILQQVVPEEYYSHFRTDEKDETLGQIIVDLVSNLGAFMTTDEMLCRIIDERETTPEVTIAIAQTKAVEILIAKRASIHNDFMRRIGQARDTVSMDVVEDLKAAIRKVVKEKAKIAAKCERLKEKLEEAEAYAGELEADLRKEKKRSAKLNKLAALLVSERKSGKKGAAFAAAVPPPDRIGEGDFFSEPLSLDDLAVVRPPKKAAAAPAASSEDDEDDGSSEEDTAAADAADDSDDSSGAPALGDLLEKKRPAPSRRAPPKFDQ